MLQYGSPADVDNCTTAPTRQTPVFAYAEAQQRNIACIGSPVPLAVQGYGPLLPDDNNTMAPFFPPPLLTIDSASINIVTFGAVQPFPLLQPPASYYISRVQTFCVSGVTAVGSDAAVVASLTVPYFSSREYPKTCLRATLPAGGVLTFYTGEQASSSAPCIPSPGATPLPWYLSGWTAAPVVPNDDNGRAGVIAAGVLVPTAAVVAGAAAGVLWLKRRQRLVNRPPLASLAVGTGLQLGSAAASGSGNGSDRRYSNTPAMGYSSTYQ